MVAESSPRPGLARRGDAAVAAVLVVTFVALVLRLWHLQFQSLWWDEGVSIYLSGLGIRALTVAKDFGVDLHPPGYHLALASWRFFLGPSVFSDRLFSVFCGTLTVPLMFQFVRSIGRFNPHPLPPLPGAGEVSSGKSLPENPSPAHWGKGMRDLPRTEAAVAQRMVAALVAALLVAISPIDVYYSQETRMYALLPVLGLISLIATTRLFRSGKPVDWIVWILIGAAGLYTYYYLGLLTAAEALVLLWVAARRSQVRWWFLAQVATVALYLPWALLMVRRLGGTALALPAATAVHLTPTTFLLENWQDFTLGFTLPPGATAVMAALAIAILVGTVTLIRRDPALAALLVLGVVVPLAGAGAVLLVRPFFYPRFVLFAAIPVWVLAAIGLTAYRRLWPLAALVLLAILASNGWTWYHERTTPRVGYAPDDYRTVFATLQTGARPGDVVLCGYPWQAGYVQAYLWNRGVRTAFLPGHVDPQQIEQAIGPTGRVWVYEYSPNHHFEGNWLEQVLAPRDPTLVVDQYGDSRVLLFSARPAGAGAGSSFKATFGGEIALVSDQVEAPATARPGDVIRATLRWRALATPKRGYTVFLHLLGPDGKVAAQHDGPPVDGAFPTDHWSPGEELVDRYSLTVPPTAPSGRYQIELGLYEPSNGQRLVVGPTPEKDNRIVIGEVTVGG